MWLVEGVDLAARMDFVQAVSPVKRIFTKLYIVTHTVLAQLRKFPDTSQGASALPPCRHPMGVVPSSAGIALPTTTHRVGQPTDTWGVPLSGESKRARCQSGGSGDWAGGSEVADGAGTAHGLRSQTTRLRGSQAAKRDTPQTAKSLGNCIEYVLFRLDRGLSLVFSTIRE